MLPPFETTTMKPSEIYSLKDKKQCSIFKTIFIECIKDHDCWAIVINDEIIYNKYTTKKSFKTILEEENVKNTLCNNPIEMIYLFMNSNESDCKVCLYMLEENPYFITIKFNESGSSAILEYTKSTGYNYAEEP